MHDSHVVLHVTKITTLAKFHSQSHYCCSHPGSLINCHDVHSSFHGNESRNSKVTRGRQSHEHDTIVSLAFLVQ